MLFLFPPRQRVPRTSCAFSAGDNFKGVLGKEDSNFYTIAQNKKHLVSDKIAELRGLDADVRGQKIFVCVGLRDVCVSQRSRRRRDV